MKKRQKTVGIIVMAFGYILAVLLFSLANKLPSKLCTFSLALYFAMVVPSSGAEIADGKYTLNAKLIFKFLNGLFLAITIPAIFHGMFYLLVINTGWNNEIWRTIANIISFIICVSAAIFIWCIHLTCRDYKKKIAELNETISSFYTTNNLFIKECVSKDPHCFDLIDDFIENKKNEAYFNKD